MGYIINWGASSRWSFHPNYYIQIILSAHARITIGNKRPTLFTEFRGVTQADFWKTHPNIDEFSRNLPGSCPDISQKLHRYSQNIDGVGLRHAPENSNFGKISG